MTSCRAHVVDNAMHSWHTLFPCPTRFARHTQQPDRVFFMERIGTSDAGCIALFTALGFGVFQTASGFDEVKMWIVSVGGHELARRVRTRLSLILGNQVISRTGSAQYSKPFYRCIPPLPLVFTGDAWKVTTSTA